jgi:hypothetical protein
MPGKFPSGIAVKNYSVSRDHERLSKYKVASFSQCGQLGGRSGQLMSDITGMRSQFVWPTGYEPARALAQLCPRTDLWLLVWHQSTSEGRGRAVAPFEAAPLVTPALISDLAAPRQMCRECAINVPYVPMRLSISSHFCNLGNAFRASVFCG